MDDQKLDQMFEMTAENNRMLHAMRRNAFIGGILKFAFWVLILVVIPYYMWLYIQPYVQEVQGTYQHVTEQSQQADSVFAEIGKFFSQFGGASGK
jgi:hypothetical protein